MENALSPDKESSNKADPGPIKIGKDDEAKTISTKNKPENKDNDFFPLIQQV